MIKVIHSEERYDPNKYGIPQLKKFPMPDAKHVKSAIKFFNYVTPRYEKELAMSIIARAKEYGVDFSEMSIGKDNRFSKYIPDNSLAHHGILGQKWGVRRFQNPDGTLTAAGKRRYQYFSEDVKKRLEKDADVVNVLQANGKKAVDMAEELSNKYGKAFDSFNITARNRKGFYEYLLDNYSWDIEDEEDFKRCAESALEDWVYLSDKRMISKDLSDSKKNYDHFMLQYASDVTKYVNYIANEYKDVRIKDAYKYGHDEKGYTAASYLVNEALQSSFPAYLFRHFYDYEVYDSDEFYSMVNRVNKQISYNDYKFYDKHYK